MSQDFLVEVGTEELPPKALKTLMDAFASGIETGLGRAAIRGGSSLLSGPFGGRRVGRHVTPFLSFFLMLY